MARKGWTVTPGRVGFYDAETGTSGHYDQGADSSLSPSTITSGMETKRDRLRSLGEVAAGRQAYQADFSTAQGNRADGLQARGQQMEAAGLHRDAAMGNAPSRAAIMGQQAAGQGLEATLGASAGGRGLAAAAAQQQAMRAQGGMQLGAMSQATGMRAQEIGDARGQYAGAMGGVRGGDYASQGLSQQQAEAQAAAENFQRRLNQQGQMGYEQLGLNQTQMQVDAELRRMQIQAGDNAAMQGVREARNARNQQLVVSGIGAIGAAAGSDRNLKQGVRKLSFSDAHAKQQAYALGRAHQWEQAKGGKPVEWAYDMPDEITEQATMSGPRGKASKTGGKAASESVYKLDPGPQRADVANRDKEETAGRIAMAEGAAMFPVIPAVGAGYMAGGQYANTHAGAYAQPAQREMQSFQREQPPAPVAMSDERTKGKVVPLVKEDGSYEQHYDADVAASAPDAMTGASLSGPTPKYSSAPAPAPAPKPKASFAASHAKRKVPPDDLKRMADEMLGMQQAQHQASLDEGPSVKDDPMGKALADMQPYEYEYKPQFGGGEGQQPGEKNVGPMAQDMAKNPITGSAVVRRPDGMLAVDMTKAGKLSLGAIGYLAGKQREQAAEIARLKKGGG